MQSYFNPELGPLVETALRFAKKEILGKVVNPESLEKPGFPWDAIRAGGAAGFLTGPLDEENGGANLDLSALAVLVEHLAEGAAGPAAIFASHLAATTALTGAACAKPILSRIAEHCADSMPPLIGIALPATVTSLDRPAIPLIVKKGGDLIVSGDFISMPSPENCRWVLLPSSEDNGQVFLIESDKMRSFMKPIYPGSGLDEFHPSRIELNDFKVTDAEIISGASSNAIYRNIRLLLAAAQVGNARSAARTALEYAKERTQTGRKIIEHQEVLRMIAGMMERVDAATGLLRLAAAASAGEEADTLARRAYTFCGSAAEDVCQDSVQTHGGYGYMKDYGVEKRLRDAKSIQCILGTYPADILFMGK